MVDPRSTENKKRPTRSWKLIAAVVGLLTLHYALAVNSLVLESPTVDEVLHLPAGLTYWQKHTFRLYPHNPPLVKLLAALPLVGDSRISTEPLYQAAAPFNFWAQVPPNKAGFGQQFAEQNASIYFEIFTKARLMLPLYFGVLGGLVVFLWSRQLYGNLAGLVSLTLWSLCPNILAHGRLITSDVAATSLGAGATYLFWRYLKQPSFRAAALAGSALGIAQLAKFSMLLLFGIWPFLWIILVGLTTERSKLKHAIMTGIAHGTVVVGLALLIINLGYGFEGTGTPLKDFEFASTTFTKDVPPGMSRPTNPNDRLLTGAWRYRVNRFRDTWLGKLPAPLPKQYLIGFDLQKLESDGVERRMLDPQSPNDRTIHGYPVYLNGTLRQQGWREYYLLCFLYKVPEGTLALILFSLVPLILVRRSHASWADEITILSVPITIILAMSFATDINLGLRYVLPIFPYLYIGVGRLVPWIASFATLRLRQAGTTLLGGCLLTSTLAAILIHPHYLAYFNWASGGASRGAEHLIDSNIDWGQDLTGLKLWIDQNAPGEPIGIAYFGQINPNIYNLRNEPLDWFLPPPLPGTMESVPMRYLRNPPGSPLKPGLYAISVSLVKGLPWRVYDSSRWIPWEAKQYAYSYFDKLKPIDQIGHSIMIYRITDEDAERLAPLWISK